MTFNIRHATEGDREDAWSRRKEFVVDIIRRHGGDFVGLQEVLPIQRMYLNRMLEEEYRSFGRSREQNPLTGEACPIYYRYKTWEIDGRQQGQFWLSDYPESAGSKTWGNYFPRIVTWAKFTHRTSGKVLYVYNTHFSHKAPRAREKSVRLLAQRVARRLEDAPFVITGDFNCDELSVPMRFLFSKASGLPVVDTFRVLHPDTNEVLTINNFKGGNVGAKIDYVLTGPDVHVRSAKILRERRGRHLPSDHYPVTARLALP